MKTEFFRCRCGDPRHQLIVNVEDEPGYQMVTAEIYLTREYGFFKRVLSAIRYVFWGRICDYGCFTEVIFHKEDADRLHAIADAVLKYADD
jgi:hypothetical protein